MGGDEPDERSFLAEASFLLDAGYSDERPHLAGAAPGRKTVSDSKKPRNAGHRERLADRFREVGAAGLQDYELLEFLLFRSIPRADTKASAKALLARFGSLSEVLAAPVKRLTEVDGIGEIAAVDMKVVEAITKRMARNAVVGREVLSSWQQVLDYCKSAMAYEDREHFRVLFLDKKNVLIADEVQQTGTIDHTPVYPREVVRRALELSASAVILVHNHPSGDTTPSRADIDMTKAVVVAAKQLGIAVHDHIIIGKKGHASMKGMRLI